MSKDLFNKIINIVCIILSVIALGFAITACCLLKSENVELAVESVVADENGNIVITYTDDTSVVIPIPDGTDGEDGKSAYDLYLETVPEGETAMTEEEWLASLKGTDGVNGADGTNGVNGLTPFIGENGNWWIGEEDTGVKAEGVDGTTPTIEINDDGYWVINGEVTDVKAEGVDGTDGEDGKSAYEIYLETVPEGETAMTEEEWLASLKGTDGVGIANISLTEKGELIIRLTDDSVFIFPLPIVSTENVIG